LKNVLGVFLHGSTAGLLLHRLASHDEIVDACCYTWNALTAETGRIISNAHRDWLHSVSSSTDLA